MSDLENEVGQPGEERQAQHDHAEVQVPGLGLSPSSTPSRTASPRPGYQQLVCSDPVVLKYFEEEPSVTILERRGRLQGYEIYIVEQWACSRTHPTSVVTTYTGDSVHSITVGVLSIPGDESSWSPRLKVYFKAMLEYHAREQETPLGRLMVTNLSTLPSSLTVILIPDGDVRKHREDFIVNEDLKRLGCAGRAGLSPQRPQPSTVARFHHLFRTRDTLDLYPSVLELVKLCQVSLSLYGKLAPVYADGLLCDITERSISEWWSDIGTYVYNIEAHNNTLDPSTVSALIGLLMGAFNRLKVFGAPVGKDVFDISSTKRAIGYFQKSQRMDRTRRLDRQTLMKLHKATAKSASGEGWTVPKAVKSTVAELSGKGGEMVMGMVGARDKAGIAEVETLDIESLAQLVTGAKAKWLWQGKVARPVPVDASGPFSPSDGNKVFSTDDQGNYIWTSTHRDSAPPDASSLQADQTDDVETRTGFERFKDAVGFPGLRSHQAKQFKEYVKTGGTNTIDMLEHSAQEGRGFAPNSQFQDAHHTEPFGTAGNAVRENPISDAVPSPEHMPPRKSLASQTAISRQVSAEDPKLQNLMASSESDSQAKKGASQRQEAKKGLISDSQSDSFPLLHQVQMSDALSLRKSQSLKTLDMQSKSRPLRGFPRSLSFSIIESIILEWSEISEAERGVAAEAKEPIDSMIHERVEAFFLREKADELTRIEQITIPYSRGQVQEIDDLDKFNQRQQDELTTTYYQQQGDYQAQKVTATEVISDERQRLEEGLLKHMEMLEAKLDYEVDALNSQVDEVEDGVREFERSIRNIESRVNELQDDNGQRRSSWWLALPRVFTTVKVLN